MSTVHDLGAQAADAIRELNHQTRDADAFAGPAELCWLLADLTATTRRLPQLLAQLSNWLNHQHTHAALRADDNSSPAEVVANAVAALANAARLATCVTDDLDDAHQHAAHLAAV
jgi:hypothetical protein